MPPSLHMSRLEGSGPNMRPCGSSFLLNSFRFRAGWTRTQRFSTFNSRKRFIRPPSSMIPSPPEGLGIALLRQHVLAQRLHAIEDLLDKVRTDLHAVLAQGLAVLGQDGLHRSGPAVLAEHKALLAPDRFFSDELVDGGMDRNGGRMDP